MELNYLQELLAKQDELDNKSSRATDLSKQSGLADTNIDELNKRRVQLSAERNVLGDKINAMRAQEDFNSAANDATEEEDLDSMMSNILDFNKLEPIDHNMSLNNLPDLDKVGSIDDKINFDGSLQSNPEDNKYLDIQNLMNQVGVVPANVNPMQSVGTPAELPTTVQEDNLETKPDIIEKVKALKAANPETPLSVLMEQAKKERDQEEADLLYQRGLLELLDVGNSTKVDKSGVNDQLKNVDKHYKDNVAIAIQKDKERQDKTINDPSSDISKTMKNIAKQLGMEIDPSTTAQDLMNAGLKLNTMMGLKSNSDIAKMNAEIKEKLAQQKSERDELKLISKLSQEDAKVWNKTHDAVTQLKRAKGIGKLITKQRAVASFKSRMNDYMNKHNGMKMTQAAANDISAMVSQAITGGVPAEALINKTMPQELRQWIVEGANMATGKPVAGWYSDANMKSMYQQMEQMERATNSNIAEFLAQAWTGKSPVVERNKNYQKIVESLYGMYVQPRWEEVDGVKHLRYIPRSAILNSQKRIGKSNNFNNPGIESKLDSFKPGFEKKMSNTDSTDMFNNTQSPESVLEQSRETAIQGVIDSARAKGKLATRDFAVKYLKKHGRW